MVEHHPSPQGNLRLMAKKEKAPKTPKVRKPKPEWMRTLSNAYSVARKAQPLIGLWLTLIFVTVLVIGIFIGIQIGHPIYVTFLTIPIATLFALFTFSRIAERAAYASIEGQLGAGASVLMSIKKGWHTVPGVAANRNQDVVHRSISRSPRPARTNSRRLKHSSASSPAPLRADIHHYLLHYLSQTLPRCLVRALSF